MTFFHGALMTGLIAVAIPVIIHLLNRRRFDLVDWAAMQFLHACERRRRKILIDDWLVLALRIALVTILVLAAAGPLTRWRPFGGAADRPPRDAVVILDGSASMSYRGDVEPADELAKRWASGFLHELRPGDGVAVLQAKERPVIGLPFTADGAGRAADAINNLPKPRGGIDWTAAVQFAAGMLGKDDGRAKDIVLLGDGQRHGWADRAALERWELLARGTDAAALPRLWAVNVANRAADAPSAALGPITADRTLAPAGREVHFRTDLRLHGQWKKPPGRVRIEVDGRPGGELKAGDGSGRIPLSFTQRLQKPGAHLVSVFLDESPLPGFDRQDYAIDVVAAVPVLIVDNGLSPRDGSRSSDFLRDALAPARDPEPSFRVPQITAGELTSASLARAPGSDAHVSPRVLVLADVARLEPAQVRAIESFLGAGGGVLVAFGPNSDPAFWNGEPYHDGRGWLPARLAGIVGDESDLARAARPVPASLEHPALALFKEAQPGGFASAYFPRHWKLETPGSEGGVAIAVLTDRLPLFAEKTFGKGRVIAAAVPLDNSWRSNLTDLGDYVRLTHELLYYLAGAGSADRNLLPRQPIVYRPVDTLLTTVTIEAPSSAARTLRPSAWPLVFEDTAEPGAYKLTPPSGPAQYYVVQGDPAEADLTPLIEADRSRVAERLPTLHYVNRPDEVTIEAPAAAEPFDWSLLLLSAVIALLGLELFAARRTAEGR